MQTLEATPSLKRSHAFSSHTLAVHFSLFGPDVWNAPEDMRYPDPILTLYEKE